MALGSTLAACSERVTRAISAEDRALTETAGFLSIIILAIVGLFGPTRLQMVATKIDLVAGDLPREKAA